MRALLDTHAFLWWNIEPELLSPDAHELIADGENELFLSAASAWEIAIKYGKGHLSLPGDAESFVISRVTARGFRPLPIEISHAVHVCHLPPLHKDPFDRLIISQSQLESLPIITADANIARYDVEIIW